MRVRLGSFDMLEGLLYPEPELSTLVVQVFADRG